MANKPNQKAKLLYVAQALIELTDEERSATTGDIVAYLAEHGIDAERKSVYRDLAVLRDFGLDAEQPVRGRWQLIERPFSAGELRLLCDAVRASGLIPGAEAEFLAGKLMRFASAGQRKELEAAVEAPAGARRADGSVPESIATIRRAMAERRKVSFVQRREPTDPAAGERTAAWQRREATPVSIVYAQGLYWLVAFFEAAGDVDAAVRVGNNQVHRLGRQAVYMRKGDRGWFDRFRIDRMGDVRVSEARAARNAQVANWRLAEQDAPQFGMEGVAPVPVTLIATAGAEDTVHEVLERLGGGARTEALSDEAVRLHVRAPLSRGFFSWLASFGGDVGIERPARAREAYRAFLEGALSGVDRAGLAAQHAEEMGAALARRRAEEARAREACEERLSDLRRRAKAEHDAHVEATRRGL